MRLETEYRGALLRFVASDPLENGGPVMDDVRADMHRGIIPIDILSVHPDLLRFFQRHRSSPYSLHRPIVRDVISPTHVIFDFALYTHLIIPGGRIISNQFFHILQKKCLKSEKWREGAALGDDRPVPIRGHPYPLTLNISIR
jgi:hypothetical protein